MNLSDSFLRTVYSASPKPHSPLLHSAELCPLPPGRQQVYGATCKHFPPCASLQHVGSSCFKTKKVILNRERAADAFCSTRGLNKAHKAISWGLGVEVGGGWKCVIHTSFTEKNFPYNHVGTESAGTEQAGCEWTHRIGKCVPILTGYPLPVRNWTLPRQCVGQAYI